MTERLPFLKAMVGSVNYNLQVPESDKDYKLFVYPTYDDMFTNRDFSKSHTPAEGDDVEYKDLRHLSNLLWKANVNYTEVLFSQELTAYPFSNEFVGPLHDRREAIARMNLPYLHASSLGMLRQKVKTSARDYKAGQAWGKDAMSAYRIADFFLRYEASGFESFGEAIRYSDAEREFMLSFRREEMSYEEAMAQVFEMEDKLKVAEHNLYVQDGLETKAFVEEIMRDAVRENLKREFITGSILQFRDIK